VTNRHAVSIFASVVATALVLWFLWKTDDEPSVATPPPAAPPAQRANDAALQRSTAGTPVDTNAAPDRIAGASREPDVAPLPDDRRMLRGTLVVTDAANTRHERTNGSMRLDAVTPLDANAASVDEVVAKVNDGRWEAIVPRRATEFSVENLVLDGRPARCDDTPKLTADDTPIELRARWFEPLRLRVLGSDTGADLTDIRVVQMGDWMRAQCPHPGTADILPVLAHATSPLLVPHAQRLEEQRFWVHAPGYAWNQINLNTSERGERLLQLVPGGDVDVTIVGTPPEGSVLRVHAESDNGRPFAELALRKGVTRVDALPEGRWQLTVEKGKWFGEPLVAGSTTVEITRGTIGTASITVAETTRPPMVQLQGTLQLDAAWGSEDIAIELQPMRAARSWSEERAVLPFADMKATGDGRHRFGPIPILAGSYAIVVRGCEHRLVTEIGPANPTELDIVVPPPNLVRVRLVDAVTEAVVTTTPPTWYSQPPQGWEGGWSHAQCKKADDGWYEFRAPAGVICINVDIQGYSFVTDTRLVVPGPNEFVLRLSRACGIDIELKDGDVLVPWPNDASASIVNVVTKAGPAYWSGSRVAAREPGEHILTIEGIDGYQPVPPRKVTITAGEWTKVEIPLQRKP